MGNCIRREIGVENTENKINHEDLFKNIVLNFKYLKILFKE